MKTDHPRMKPTHRWWLPLLAIVLAAAWVDQASGQLMVTLQMTKKTYVAFEPLELVVSVANRTGRDVVLHGPATGEGWLSFEVLDNSGHLIAPANTLEYPPIAIRNGFTEKHKVNIGANYPLGDYGNYRIRATAYYSPSSQYYSSNRISVNITDGKVIWEQVVGVPQGRAGAGGMRRYMLLTYRDKEKTNLYVRVKNENSGAVLTTHRIGRILLFSEPQVTVDGDNRLHIFYNGAPKTFVHAEVELNGTVNKPDVYRELGTTNRPYLVTNRSGGVKVVGGKHLNPDTPEADVNAGIRRLSERPPGLPF